MVVKEVPVPCRPPTSRPPNPRAAAAALTSLTLATFCYVTVDNLPFGLLSLLAEDLRVSTAQAGRLVTWYALTVAAAAIPLSVLTRRIPRRHLFTGLLAGYVVTTLLSAVAVNYWMLLVARVATALTQAAFWAAVGPTAAGLFPPAVRGRVIATVFGGASLASILGVPASTWIGQQASWRVPFAILSGLGTVTLIAVASLLPNDTASQGAAATGTSPSIRRYALLMAVVPLTVSGAFSMYTYVSPFLTTVSGFSAAAVGPVLTLSGLAGLGGNIAIGAVFDRSPRLAVLGPAALITVVLLGWYGLGDSQVPAAVLIALWGFSVACLATALQSRMLQIAPGSTDVAAAGGTVAFSIGTASGAWIGGVVLNELGVRSTAAAGAVLAAAGLIVLLSEPLLASARIRRSGAPPRP